MNTPKSRFSKPKVGTKQVVSQAILTFTDMTHCSLGYLVHITWERGSPVLAKSMQVPKHALVSKADYTSINYKTRNSIIRKRIMEFIQSCKLTVHPKMHIWIVDSSSGFSLPVPSISQGYLAMFSKMILKDKG